MGRHRGHGEGTIYQRPDDRWCAQLTLEGGMRHTLYGKTRAEVARRLAEAIRDRDKGLPLVGERMTVGRYLSEWLEVKAQRVEVTSMRRYEQLVRLHLVPTLGRTSLSRLTATQVQRLYAVLLSRDGGGLSARTVSQLHTLFKHALRDALKRNLVQRNVLDMVDPPRSARHEMHPLDPAQATALLHALEGDRLYALFVLAIHTGMRQGELLALTWRDVDLGARASLQVHASLQRAGGVKRIKEPKTRAGRRRIALSASAVAALRRHHTEQLVERAKAGPAWQEQDLVFPNRRGKMAAYTTVTLTHFKPALARAGLPDIRFHDLRHTAATLALLQNVPAKVVSEMLGHASVAITLDLYSHVLPSMQDSAADAFDRLFV